MANKSCDIKKTIKIKESGKKTKTQFKLEKGGEGLSMTDAQKLRSELTAKGYKVRVRDSACGKNVYKGPKRKSSQRVSGTAKKRKSTSRSRKKK